MTPANSGGSPLACGGLVALVLVAALGCGTGDGGALTLTIDQPIAALDPLGDPRLAQLALYDDATGEPLGVVPLRTGERREVAELSEGRRDFRLEGLSTGGQLLAIARAFDVDVSRQTTAEVMLHLRKPLAYLGRQDGLHFFDTAQAPDVTQEPAPLAIGPATAIGATRMGDLVLAAVDLDSTARLVWVDTATHNERGRAKLVAPATAIVLDPRDRRAALLHPADGSITLVDLAQLRGGAADAALTAIDVPSPTHATFDDDGNLLVVSSTMGGCDAPSGNPGMLFHLDPGGSAVNSPLALPALAADVAWNALTGRPVLALPCQNLIVDLAADGSVKLADARNVGDVVIDGRMLYAVDWVPADSEAQLTARAVVLDLASGRSREVTFTYEPMLLTVPGVVDGHGNPYYLGLPATDFQAPDLAVSPHGMRATFIHEITYHVVTDINSGVPGTGCDALTIDVVERGVSLVDLEAAQLVYSSPTDYRVACDCDGRPLGPSGNCFENLGPGDPPTAVTVLMGAE